MSRHPCRSHRPGHHDDACLSGPCGFCGTDLQTIASGECRSCLRIVCEACDSGYEPDRGPVCAPCTQSVSPGPEPASSTPPDGYELHRLCVFALSLSCGHLVTYFVNGWYPVAVACCDRLGGTILEGVYVAYASNVEYVDVLSEQYEHRPPDAAREPDELRDRQPRTDEPYRSPHPGGRSSAGRYPCRVGAAWSIDGSTAPTTPS